MCVCVCLFVCMYVCEFVFRRPTCVRTHPHATAWLLHNFAGRHQMLKMDMDKTIVTQGRTTVQQWHITAHTHVRAHARTQRASSLTPNVRNLMAKLQLFPKSILHRFSIPIDGAN